MKIVLDTNAFISGIFFSGPPAQILEEWGNKRFQILLSEQILNEYQSVAEALSLKYPEVDIEQRIELIAILGKLLDTKGVERSV